MTRRQCASGRRPRSSAMWHITASLSGRASWSSAGACCPPRRTATTTLPPQSSIQIENSILLNFVSLPYQPLPHTTNALWKARMIFAFSGRAAQDLESMLFFFLNNDDKDLIGVFPALY
uniref:Uncharacterized protein n=1 Tax=Ixodes ricinus TaxID=34613 RepID=A0A6B0UMI4_IXORI